MNEAADEALQRALADACLGVHSAQAFAADLRGWLEGHGVAPEDVEAIAEARPRLAVYRSLVRNGLSSVVLTMLPATRARMGSRFDADLATFVDEVGPRTHYLRDIPSEFFAWAEPRWRADAGVPPYLVDLATHELATFAIAASAPSPSPLEVVDIALDRPLAFADSVRLLRFGWAVHELRVDAAATDEPARRDVRLLGYRDANHSVRWLELTPLASRVLDRLALGEPLGRAVDRACAEHAVVPAAVLPDIARLLADLGARGVLLGAHDRSVDGPPDASELGE